MARTYAELNTSLDFNQASVVPELNGRIGDNNREVYFWLKDGNSNYDLTGKSITLFAKDASSVVKTASTINDQTGISTGRFSLIIPKEFYQAAGAVQDAYIQIKNGDTVITSIPVSFHVFENTMLVTQTQSQVFIDSVQGIIDKTNQQVSALTTDLSVVQNAMDALKISIANLNDQYNSDLFAQKAKDNDFKGNNTFDQKIIAPNGLQGKADSAGQADNATNATHANNADLATKATTADTLTPTNNQTVQNLTVNGQLLTLAGQKNYVKTVTDQNGLQFTLNRVGNIVFAFFYGNPNSTGSNTWISTVPAGYRPVSDNYFTVEGIWDNLMTFVVKQNGQVLVGTHASSNGGQRGVQGSSSWLTLDDYPS